MNTTTQAAETTEQTTDTTQATDTGISGPGRDELVAALEGIDLEAAANETPEQVQAAQAAADAAKVAGTQPADDANVPEVVRLIRAREQAQKVRDEGKSAADTLLSEARAEGERIKAEMIAQAKAEAQAIARQQLEQLRSKPLEAIKQIGWNTQDLVDQVTREGDPQWQAMQQLRAQQEQFGNQVKTAEERAKAAEEAAKAYTVQVEEAQRIAAEHEFMGLATADRAPSFRKAAESFVQSAKAMGLNVTHEQVMIQRAHEAARDIRKAGGVATPATVVQYLEYVTAQSMGGGAVGQVVDTTQQAAASQNSRPTGRANGTRTLSAAGASERRSAPKPIHDMSPAEERQALAEAAAEAMRTSTR
jgi:hypothetical protein